MGSRISPGMVLAREPNGPMEPVGSVVRGSAPGEVPQCQLPGTRVERVGALVPGELEPDGVLPLGVVHPLPQRGEPCRVLELALDGRTASSRCLVQDGADMGGHPNLVGFGEEG